MKVINLIPGMQFKNVIGEGLHTFIARCNHPFYEGFQLVIWRLADGIISLDALSAMQDVGTPEPSEPGERRHNLQTALHGERRSK